MNNFAVVIQLTKGYEAIVDAQDGDLVAIPWHVNVSGHTAYAVRRSGGKSTQLSRVIMERVIERLLTCDEVVDHIDRNGLNNRRSNLRLATRQQDLHNSKKPDRGTNRLKGASWSAKARKWRAQITINYQVIYLGYFDTEEKAHAAYCQAAAQNCGQFARAE